MERYAVDGEEDDVAPSSSDGAASSEDEDGDGHVGTN